MRRAPIINRSVLSDQVKDYLLAAILAGDFPPGSRIVETRVAGPRHQPGSRPGGAAGS
jgi:DNA-binding GntR family transcriptional regulator